MADASTTLPDINRQWLINGNPRGRALSLDDFKRHEAPMQPLADGEVRVRVETLSFDPSQKGQMENVSGYASGNDIGNVMTSGGLGEVVESRHATVKVGDKVSARVGWQEYAVLPGAAVQVLPNDEFLTARLGPLGGTGLTAYFGFFRVGRPEPGDTVVVSGAAGAVGSIVGQLAKIMGCRTVGIAGGAEKCAWLVDELGYDAAVDYKNDNVKAQLRELCPNGIDVFFDNVGGAILNDALACIAAHARVVICGGISRYEQSSLPPGPPNYFNIVFRQATMEGFLLTGYEQDYPLAQQRIMDWIKAGKIVYREDTQEGFDNIPATLLRLFSGANFGKQLLKL
jgi:NADPH-dependent curcumin reductase CurA